jgi:plastocyanin
VKSSGTYAVKFDTAGVYQYDCAVHGSAMTGTIVVR